MEARSPEFSEPRLLSSDLCGREGPSGAELGGIPRGEPEEKVLLLGVVGREGGRPMFRGLVGIGPGAERGVPADPEPLESDGERVRRLGNGGARDIKQCRPTSTITVMQETLFDSHPHGHQPTTAVLDCSRRPSVLPVGCFSS